MLHILTHRPSQLQEVTATIIPPALQLRELRHGDVNGLARGHPAGNGRATQAARFQNPCTCERLAIAWEKEKQAALYSSIPQKWILRKLLTLRQFRWRLEFQRGNQRRSSLLLSVPASAPQWSSLCLHHNLLPWPYFQCWGNFTLLQFWKICRGK